MRKAPHLNPLPRGARRQVAQRERSRLGTADATPADGSVGRGLFYKSAFLQSEPILKKRIWLGMRWLGKIQDGFGRRSEPKLKGAKVRNKGRMRGFGHG